MDYEGIISNSAEMREGGGSVPYSQDIRDQNMYSESLKSSISPNKSSDSFKQVERKDTTLNTTSGSVVVNSAVNQKEEEEMSIIPTTSVSTTSSFSSELPINNSKYTSIHETTLMNIFSYMRKSATVRFSPVIAEPMDMRIAELSSLTTTKPLLILATTVIDSMVWNS